MNQVVTRRQVLLAAAGAPAIVTAKASLTSPERVRAALGGKPVDRPPFCLWHHFGLEKQGAAAHARKTLEFHRAFKTDFIKVMSDFPFPKGESKVLESPFPEQLKALEIIRDQRPAGFHFVETLFNPWNVAEKLSSPADVRRLMKEKPQQLLDRLETIARSQANHARKALALGASGIFLAIANAQDGILTPAEYARFSEPFDRIVLAAVKGSPLNILHLHGPKTYVDSFLHGWDAVIHYSVPETGKPFTAARTQFAGVLMGGIDHQTYRTATVDDLKKQIAAAREQAGARFLLAPGCSVPDQSEPAELSKLSLALGLIS